MSRADEHPQHQLPALADVAEAVKPLLDPGQQLRRVRAGAEPGDEEKDVVWFALIRIGRSSLVQRLQHRHIGSRSTTSALTSQSLCSNCSFTSIRALTAPRRSVRAGFRRKPVLNPARRDIRKIREQDRGENCDPMRNRDGSEFCGGTSSAVSDKPDNHLDLPHFAPVA